jgi:cytoskeleton protein RodZ
MATTIGEQLRLSREEQGIALREISNQTRISMRYLEAIESNDYKRLPGGIFNRSFVKAYARFVGFDETQAVEGYAQYLREQGQASDDDVPPPHYSKVYSDTPATRSPILTVFLAILILVVVTFGALAIAHWYKRRSAAVPEQRRPRAELVKDRREVHGRLLLPGVIGFDGLGGEYEGTCE